MKKKLGRLACWLVSLLLIVVVSGCAASFLNKSAATVGAVASIYDIGMHTVADLQAAGYITAEQRTEINKVATVVKNALMVADKALIAYNDALAVYNNEKSDTNSAKLAAAKAALKASVGFVNTSWGDLAKLVNSIKPDTLPETL